MPHCFIALGGNLGSVEQTFESALQRLDEIPRCALVAVSRFRRTAPVGDEAGGEFLNAAAGLDTELTPLEVLDLLQSIERDFGRVRDTHWAPRTLDLDLLFHGSEIISSPRLVVPHPAAWYRRFVLDPLVEIAPHFVHPERQADIQMLRDRLLPRPLPVALAGGTAQFRDLLARRLAASFPEVRFACWAEPLPAQPDPPDAPAIVFWLGENERSPGGPAGFDALPPTSRIDATAFSESPDDFVRNVLRSALG